MEPPIKPKPKHRQTISVRVPLGLSAKELEILERESQHHADQVAQNLAARPEPTKIEVWCEGYQATGESAGAHLLGRVVAPDFNNAVLKVMAETEDVRSRKCYRLSEDGTWSMWGCQLFDNSIDARRTFG